MAVKKLVLRSSSNSSASVGLALVGATTGWLPKEPNVTNGSPLGLAPAEATTFRDRVVPPDRDKPDGNPMEEQKHFRMLIGQYQSFDSPAQTVAETLGKFRYIKSQWSASIQTPR